MLCQLAELSRSGYYKWKHSVSPVRSEEIRISRTKAYF